LTSSPSMSSPFGRSVPKDLDTKRAARRIGAHSPTRFGFALARWPHRPPHLGKAVPRFRRLHLSEESGNRYGGAGSTERLAASISQGGSQHGKIHRPSH